MEKIIKKIKYNINGTNSTYIVINLNNNYYDIGFYTDSGYKNNNLDDTVKPITVKGITISRLNELKKYTESQILENKYIISVNDSNGILLEETDENVITYLIDNIKFFDNLNDGSSSFEFLTPNQHSDLNKNILIKEDRYLNYVNYKEKSDIEIVRQSLNIFESHIRLSDIKNVEELTLYGGTYYNIFKNS